MANPILPEGDARPAETKRWGGWRRYLPPIVTLLIFWFIFQRIPFEKFLSALQQADYPHFLALMLPNSIFYFAWDTLVLAVVLRWFHGPIRYRDLLPARAVTYVVALMNTQLARGALAVYLTRQLQAPFFQIASTVIFLTLVEMTHLAAWATSGMLAFHRHLPSDLFWVPLGFGLFWLVFLLYARRDFAPWRVLLSWMTRLFPFLRGRLRLRQRLLFRTFDQAPLKRYVQLILLRAPMFFVALVIHYLAVRTFGIEIPFLQLMGFLPIIFMLAALPITVAHLGTTQAAWIFFFSAYASPSQLLAYSLASHLAFMLARGLLGVVFLRRAYKDLFEPLRAAGLVPASAPPAQSS